MPEEIGTEARQGSEPAPSGKTPAGVCGGRKKTIPFSHHKRVLPPSIPLPAAYQSSYRCTRARFECERLWDIFSFLLSRLLSSASAEESSFRRGAFRARLALSIRASNSEETYNAIPSSLLSLAGSWGIEFYSAVLY